jgi:hypothetical protein
MVVIVRGNRLGGDIGGSMDGSSMDDGGNEGDSLLCDGSVRRRLESSTPSLSSSTSHLRFLVRFAGGNIGCGVSAGAWALAVATVTGDGQAVMVQKDTVGDGDDICG